MARSLAVILLLTIYGYSMGKANVPDPRDVIKDVYEQLVRVKRGMSAANQEPQNQWQDKRETDEKEEPISRALTENITDVIAESGGTSCVMFPKRNGDNFYIAIRKGGICEALTGYSDCDWQILVPKIDECRQLGWIMRLLLYTLGMLEESFRESHANYGKIFKRNGTKLDVEEYKKWFLLQTGIPHHLATYGYCGVLHFPAYWAMYRSNYPLMAAIALSKGVEKYELENNIRIETLTDDEAKRELKKHCPMFNII